MVQMVQMKKAGNTLHYSSLFSGDTMPQFKAITILGDDFNQQHPCLEHVHKNTLEILFVDHGDAEYSVNGTFYPIRAGDMILCNAGVPHGDHPKRSHMLSNYCCAVTDVSLRDLPPNCLIGERENPVLSCGSYADSIAGMMTALYSLACRGSHMEDACSALSLSLLVLARRLLQERKDRETPAGRTDLLVERIKRYLDLHYRESLNLEDIGAALRISPSYLSHILKEKAGWSPIQYVAYRRIGEAQSALRYTTQPIGEIADSLGFRTLTYFDAVFTKYVGMSPKEYRRLHLSGERKEAALPDR